jgi:proline iminopeptidase
MAILEAHYIRNNCFIPEDFIMKNIDKIENIPVSIVHGRYDFICTPAQAFRLHSGLKKSSLNITNAGHSSSDTDTKQTLIRELRKITVAG